MGPGVTPHIGARSVCQMLTVSCIHMVAINTHDLHCAWHCKLGHVCRSDIASVSLCQNINIDVFLEMAQDAIVSRRTLTPCPAAHTNLQYGEHCMEARDLNGH